ncbi:alkaline shock protein 23 family protein [Lentilactobacillus kisonensis DSM 19906 = JCM 15041]|uniref:Stress response regulator gls24 homolog n=3 Tax=Lentilactobacillus kisonensis TaxID=481722 RepID=H1LL03_9LACO|nr:alkaline shock protein 23 family protein [Lentilactobacillus kisonensis F0435]KRL19700.1 alkaline shock protein 23 family protein [Lentilactobacillus kisonensis DSM 19906 = JCM 15041]
MLMDATVQKPELTKKLTFENSVIEKIAGLVCRNVDGILSLDGGMISELADRFSKSTDPTKGIDAEVGEKQVALDMEATIEYGADARQIFDEVCTRTQRAIKNYTGLDVIEINLNINDVLTKQEWEQQSNRKKDKIANDVNDDRVQ